MSIAHIINKTKYLSAGVAAIVSAALLASCDGTGSSGAGSAPAFNPDDSLHLVGYMLGRDMGKALTEMRETGVEFNDTILVMALREVLAGAPSQVPDSTLKVTDARFKGELNAKRRQKRTQIEEENLNAANAFLEEHKKNAGVVVTESGLQYIVLQEGTGAKPKLKDRVKVHYHGTLPDGTVFDSSVDRGSPASFALDGVIRGWTEALQLMKVGSKYKIAVPPDLAYGRRGARPPIGPNSALIFEIELIEIEK